MRREGELESETETEDKLRNVCQLLLLATSQERTFLKPLIISRYLTQLLLGLLYLQFKDIDFTCSSNHSNSNSNNIHQTNRNATPLSILTSPSTPPSTPSLLILPPLPPSPFANNKNNNSTPSNSDDNNNNDNNHNNNSTLHRPLIEHPHECIAYLFQR